MYESSFMKSIIILGRVIAIIDNHVSGISLVTTKGIFNVPIVVYTVNVTVWAIGVVILFAIFMGLCLRSGSIAEECRPRQ